MFGGIIENPASPYQLGQPVWSNKVYADYMNWRSGDSYWKTLEASFLEQLRNGATQAMATPEQQMLFDGKVAEENKDDARWMHFAQGRHECVIDMKKMTDIRTVMLRYLNYNAGNVVAPMKTYLYLSNDGTNYRLAGIKDAPYFPNNKHDAWIDAVLFKDLKEKARYVKVTFDTPQQTFVDELFINPTK